MCDANLNLYKIFCVVAETKNYSEASKKLFVTESTISSHIKNLEKQLNITLFYRERDGLKITKEGQELYDAINNKIKDIDFSVESFIQNNDISKAKITIGCPSHISNFYLTKYLSKVKKDYPNLKIDIVGAADYSSLLDKLQKHLIDFVIIDVIPPEAKNEIKVEKIAEIHNTFVYNQPVTINNLKELENFNYILNYEKSFSTKELFETLKEYNIHINADLKADITEMRIEEAKEGLGIAYVMKDAVTNAIKNKELYEVELPIQLPTMKINLVYIEQYLTKMDSIFIKKYLK